MEQFAHAVEPASRAGQQGNASNSAQFHLVALLCAELLWEVSGEMMSSTSSECRTPHSSTQELDPLGHYGNRVVILFFVAQNNATNSNASLIKF